MLDSSNELTRWREALLKTGELYQWQVDELEDHLHAEYERALGSGSSPELAWDSALNSLGSNHALVREYKKESTMKLSSKLLGLAFALALLAIPLAAVGNTQLFLYLPSLLFVVSIVGGGLVAGFGPRRVLGAFTASLSSSTVIDPVDARLFGDLFARGYRLSWASGAIGFLVGFMLMLSNLGDPSELGPGMALSLLTLFYGALSAELLFANLTQWLTGRVAIAVED